MKAETIIKLDSHFQDKIPEWVLDPIFLFNFSHGVRLSPVSPAATVWPIVPAPDDR
jgi:hypothetical protein